jgi:hypothetical protein
MKLPSASVVAVLLSLSISAGAQTLRSPSAPAQVPPLIQFSNVAADEAGNPMSGVVSIIFAVYADQKGGEPLWSETQSEVRLDSDGHYSVQLGSASPAGLPPALFTGGESRWLGVRIANLEEQPRVLLVSVPYALKAGDAATIGGLPPSAFVRAEPGAEAAVSVAADSSTPPPASVTRDAGSAVTGSGTTGYLPEWTSASNLGSSVLFQAGSGSTAEIGINTTAPETTLDVAGDGTIRGALNLPATGKATSTAGANSQPLDLAAGAFDSTTSLPVKQTFAWQAEPSGNNTAAPSGTLNLLFAAGASKPAETGLSIDNKGHLNFASGQAFPGTGPGTITSVVAGADLTGGGSSGAVTLSLDTKSTDKRYAQLNAANTFTDEQTINARALVAANASPDALDVTQTSATGGDAIHGTTAGSGGTGVFGMGSIGVQGVASASSSGGSLAGLFLGTVKTTGNASNTLIGDPGCGAGYAGLGFLSGGSLGGCTNYALAGGPKGDTFINSSGTATIHFRSNNNELVTIDNKGNLNIIGQNGGGNLTVAGKLGILGTTEQIGSSTVVGSLTVDGHSQFAGNANNTFIGDPGCGSGNAGLGFIASGTLSGCTNYAIAGGTGGDTYVNARGTASIHFRSNNNELARIDNSGNLTVIGQNGGGNVTIDGNLTIKGTQTDGPISASSTGTALYGETSGQSRPGHNYGEAGVWGDTGGKADSGYYGVLGTSLENSAGGFFNNTGTKNGLPTLFVENDAPYSPLTYLGYLFEAYAPNSNIPGAGAGCIINVGGVEDCYNFESGYTIDAGERRVALSAVESTESWLEDAGEGTLSNGVAHIAIDPAFAQTVNAGAGYRVFLTPKGDCEGLYVTNETETGFDVRELRGGRSSIAFDYRITARRAGHETERLRDITEQYQRDQLRHQRMQEMREAAEKAAPPAVRQSPVAER